MVSSGSAEEVEVGIGSETQTVAVNTVKFRIVHRLVSPHISVVDHGCGARRRNATAEGKMSSEPNSRQPVLVGEIVRRPAQLIAVILAVSLLVALGLITAISWRGAQRLEPFAEHLEQLARLQRLDQAIQEVIDARRLGISDASKLTKARQRLSLLTQTVKFYDPTTPSRLRTLRQTLTGNPVSVEDMQTAQRQLLDLLGREMAMRQLALSTFRGDAKVELLLAVAALLILPGTALVVLIVLRERITQPLRDLNHLLTLIREGAHRPFPLRDPDTPLQPVMQSYNKLVSQLSAALIESQEYQTRLECEVRAASGALIRQQIELAESNRLAAVGEISARVAHELKNPLAGVQMALTNLREEVAVPDQRDRLGLVDGEVARMARLLDQLLLRPGAQPYARQDIEISHLVSELLALVRYQIPNRISLKSNVITPILAHLPRDALRQVLLNLVLNSAQAIGDGAGTITVTAIKEKNAIRLWVTDDGPGFPAEILKHGPRPFQTTRKGGMGLGLSTVQRMSRAMGGHLELMNRAPKGAVATLIVDLERH